MYVAVTTVCFCTIWAVYGDNGLTNKTTTSIHKTTISPWYNNKTSTSFNKGTDQSGISINMTTTLPQSGISINMTTTLPQSRISVNMTTTLPQSGISVNMTTTLPQSRISINMTTTLPQLGISVTWTITSQPLINRVTSNQRTTLIASPNVSTNSRILPTSGERHDQTHSLSVEGSPTTKQTLFATTSDDTPFSFGNLIVSAGIDNVIKQVFGNIGVNGNTIQSLLNMDTVGTLLGSMFTGSYPSTSQDIIKTMESVQKFFTSINVTDLPNENLQTLLLNPIMQTVVHEALKNRTYVDFIKVLISDVLFDGILYRNLTDNLQEANGNSTGDAGLVLDVMSLVRQIGLLMKPSTLSSSDLCTADMAAYLQGVSSSQWWAIQMLDASGKPIKSILKGARSFLGNYDECTEIDQPVTNGTHTRRLRGQYWKMTFTLPSSFTKVIAGNSPLETVGETVQWDWCLPSSCEKSSVTNVIHELPLESLGVELEDASPVLMDDWKEDASAVTAVVIMTLITALSVLGTSYDVVSGWLSQRTNNDDEESEVQGHTNTMFVSDDNKRLRHISAGISMVAMNGIRVYPPEELDSDDEDDDDVVDDDEEEDDDDHGRVKKQKRSTRLGEKQSQSSNSTNESFRRQLLLSFSISNNTEKIMNTRTGESNLGCIHGIRVLSMAWVILGHSISWHRTLKLENPSNYLAMAKTFTMQAVMNGTLAVDTFFLLSGCLVCYLFLWETKKSSTGKPSIKQMILYYVHRYWRLTPVYMISLMLFTCLITYLVDGPLSGNVSGPVKNCRANWWINLLYINNLYKPEEMCFSWSWFLANDMQFYIIAPLAVLPIAFGFHAVGIVVMVLLFAVHICSYGVIEYQLHGASLFINRQKAYNTSIYFEPWCRIGPFAMGLMLGYLLYRTKCKAKMPRYVLVLGWQTALVIGLLCTYITYDAWKDGNPVWPTTSVITYETLYRPGWALFVSWIIFVCCTDHGGVLNSMLSWSVWQPLGRLTYAAYLLHPVLLAYTEFSVRSLVYVRNINISYHFIGTFAVSYGLAYIACVLIEAPCMGLEKAVLNKLKLKR